MLDWNEYQKQLQTTIAEIGRISPEIVRGYRTLGDAGKSTNTLDPKIRELIAVAVAVTRQCDGCIAVHTDAALKNGASREEVTEALGVAIAVNAGAALIYSSRALDAFSSKQAAKDSGGASGT
ncbi:MAG: carboxymuconolactone decarboxylase family protein [Spirochaetia bacterium]